MNRNCPTCDADLLDHRETGGELVPYEENDRLFTLQFCSEDCRDEYKDDQ